MSFTTKLKLIKYGQMVLILIFGIMALSQGVLADAGDFGQNTYNWIKQQAFWIALLAVVVIAIPFIAKKMWMQLAGFLVLASLVLVIVDDPNRLKGLGTTIWTKVFGG